MRREKLTPEFVEFIPGQLEEGILYVSMSYGTAIHLCACGCGEKAITPLSPSDWRLVFDGETVTLWPSIGNWSFACRSHYVVRRNRIRWAEDWPESKVKANRIRQRRDKQRRLQEQTSADVGPSRKKESRGGVKRSSPAKQVGPSTYE
jgi:uncharacterized protein DUF6527